MNRRTALKCLSGTLGSGCAAAMAVPSASYVLENLRSAPQGAAIVQRVIRLADLPADRPVQAAITGNRRDAWTEYPQEVLGRVWLVRRGSDGSPEDCQVDAFAAVCPHLGCAIQADPQGRKFVCPCHKAVFELSGKPQDESELGHANHAPRGMDSLDCRLVQDEADGAWWVEVTYERFEQGLTQKVRKA